MNCEETQALFSLYLDGELDELRRKVVTRHLQQCACCNQESAALAKTVRIIQAMAGVEPTRDYFQTMKNSLRITAKE